MTLISYMSHMPMSFGIHVSSQNFKHVSEARYMATIKLLLFLYRRLLKAKSGSHSWASQL